MENNKGKKKQIWWYIGAFVLSVGIYLLVLMLGRAYPFGNACFLTEDARVQYNTMLRVFLEYIHSGDTSEIMWNHGMGVDVYLNVLYYIMSPFNIIAVILGTKYVELSMVIIVVLKCSLLPVTAMYYFVHTDIIQDGTENKCQSNWLRFCCSMAWGLCGYIVAYGQNIIWLDALILMPLIAIGVEKVNACTGWRMYVILLALTFIVNFYYAFYVCIFIVVYFILLNWYTLKEICLAVLRMLKYSILAVILAGVVLIPAALCVMRAGHSEINGSDTLAMWGDIGSYVVSFFPFKEISKGYLYNNNNYCGAIAVLAVCIFFLSACNSYKKKIKYACVTLLFMLAANFLPLNYILHGCVVTHGMGNRFAIILTFVMLIMTYSVLVNLDKLRIRYVVIAGVVGLALLGISLVDGSMLQKPICYAMYLGAVVIYMMVLVLSAKKSIKVRTAIGITSVMWIVGMCSSAVYTMKDKVQDDDMLSEIKLSEWQDVYDGLDTSDVSRKTAMVIDDYTPASEVNWYSSMINGYMVNAYSSMGLSRYDNVECVYDGTTPLTAMMYNVRYVLTNGINTNGGYHSIAQGDSYNLYEADGLAGMGFVADRSLMQWSGDADVGENQSQFLQLAFGDEASLSNGEKLMNVLPWSNVESDYALLTGALNIYSEPDRSVLKESFNLGEFEKTGIGTYRYTSENNTYPASVHIDFVADKDLDLYIYSEDTRDQAVMVYVDGHQITQSSYYSSSQLVYGGHIEKGQKVKVAVFGGASVGEKAEKHIQLYTFNTELFEKVKPYITDETLISDGYSGNSFRGHVTAKKDGVLYMAFPYSDGYTIYVDGQKAEKLLLGKGNMGVEVSAGYHDIELRYHTAGLIPGAIVSAVGVCAFVLLCIYDSRKRRNVALPDKG